MLVPLTDPDNTYSRMMLELIADQKPFPASPYPRRFSELVEPSITKRNRLGAASVAIGAFVIALAVATRVVS